MLLPLALAACTLVEVDDAGWHLTTDGLWLLALLAGIPALVAIQRAFLNPACRDPERNGGSGGGGGDGGCSDGGGGCSD